jgi:arsenate reductase
MVDTTLYGIENCDQVRRARQWLRKRGVQVRFHDFRRDGLDRATLERWLSHLPWDALLNRRGLAWRKLEPRVAPGGRPASAIEALLAEPLLVSAPSSRRVSGCWWAFRSVYLNTFSEPTHDQRSAT